jgi:hypothetical protein
MPDNRLLAGKQRKTEQQAERRLKEESSLKGTFVSVLLLGTFIVVSWIGVFVLFIARN